jgi:MFS family permease
MAVGMAGLGPIPCSAVLIRTFAQNRGRALGLSALGAALGGTVFLPTVSWLELELNWRGTLVALSAFALATLSPAVLLIRFEGQAAPQVEPGTRNGVWTYIRQRAFWLLLGLLALNIACMVPVIQLLHSHATDLTGSVAIAAAASALLTFCGAFSKPVMGFLSDSYGIKRCIGVCILLEVLGVMLVNRYLGVEWLMLGAVLFGVGYGGLGPLFAVLVTKVYDEIQFPAVIGYIGAICFPLTMLGLPFATWTYEQSGGYGIAFGVFAACFALSASLLALIKLREKDGE